MGLSANLRESKTSLLKEPSRLSFGADKRGRTRISALRFFQDWTGRDTRQVIAARSQFNLGEGLSKTKLAKRYGMQKPQDLVNWLQSMGKENLIQPGITTAPCQFVPFEYVPELDRLWAARQGCRQRILGE